MALLQCSECAGMVSDKAPSCPHCGAPIEVALAADKPSAPKPAVQENVCTLGVEVLSNPAADGSSGSSSAPVPTTGLAPSDSAVSGPACDKIASSSQPPSRDTTTAVPAVVNQPKYMDPLFPTPESREDALKIVKDTSTGFFVYAAILVVVSMVVDLAILFDAAICAGGGFALRRWNSRTAAVVLLVYALACIGLRIASGTGGVGWIVDLYVVVGGIRAVYSTFMLHGQFRTP